MSLQLAVHFETATHRVVDRRGVHVDTAVVLGHEAELIGFGLHLHRSFAGHLVIPLRSSNLEQWDGTQDNECARRGMGGSS